MSTKYKYLIVICLTLALCMATCSKKPKRHVLDLMPAPEVYSDGIVNPFINLNQDMRTLPDSILYCTDRMPDTEGKRFYLNDRGLQLRFGYARTMLGKGSYTWEEAKRISLLKNRTEKYPIKVTSVQEIGVFDQSLTVFTPPEFIPENPGAASNEFIQRINGKLSVSQKKDIYIYVHGYKVEFKNPVLVATELWHFLGYDGVFIAFAWPSTPKTLAYASDLETASLSSHNLRLLLELLVNETHAERVHIIGYSAGTRVVIGALAQLAFIHHKEEALKAQCFRKIGRVLLIGSDMDRDLFGAYLVHGLMDVPDSMSIYVSDNDKALSFSKRIFRRKRLGQGWSDSMTPGLVDFLNKTPELKIIDVTSVEGSKKGNGHAYFRNSPWASSDILMALMYDLDPDERGLVRSESNPIWDFPDDYIQRLKENLTERVPVK